MDSGAVAVRNVDWLESAVASPTPEQQLSVLLATIAALFAIVVRYRYSTERAAVYLAAVALVVLSPVSIRLLPIHPAAFLVGFLLLTAVGVILDYFYLVVTGEPTGADAFRTVAVTWIDRLRDRRRRLRRRLETILDRKTVIAVLVGMPLSEFVKATVVQSFAAEPIQWRLAWAHLALVLFGLAIGVHWERIKAAAHDAGERTEEMVDD